MRVLLTGATGFLGGAVLESLHRRGIEVVTLGRQRPDNRAFVDFIQADLLAGPDFPALINAADASHLLHLAWCTEHGKYWTSPLNLRWVQATIRLAEAFCKAGGQQVVVAGTCAEYDWSHGYCQEDSTPINPATLYGVAKDAARRSTVAICAAYRVPCAWGRIFLPYGVGDARQRLIPSLMAVLRGTKPAFGVSASSYRDFLYVSDVADAFVLLLLKAANGVYNIGSGQPVQLSRVVCELANLLDADAQIVLGLTTARPGEPPLLVGENLKIKTLGWQPALSLAQGLALAVRGEQP